MKCDIDIIKTSNDNNKLTIFVGAGVSKGSNLPSWEDLIDLIKKDLSIDNKETDYLKIAQLYYLSCSETIYYQKIKNFFPSNIEPTIIQKFIFDLMPTNIITTNWDDLLEKTAQENGYIYDVISKDEHLVQSKLQNHIIKMHGDFRDNNIVFKEDDYINYKNNFPLIENYIKSILSTNTILFLGYSYNDINLKQITKWIQNNSTIMPPMFLVVFKEDKNQSRYLENFGIKTIVIKDEDKVFGYDSYTNKLATFLKKIVENEDHIDILKMTDKDVVEFVYEKLKPLDALDAILLNQIEKSLTNCRLMYEPTKENNLTLLEFYDQIMTYNMNRNIRNIYNKFRTILISESAFQKNETIILKIFSILQKANINGIIVDNDTAQNKKYHLFPKILSKKENNTLKQICNFDFDNSESNENDIKQLRKKAFFYYQKYEFLKAYKLNEKIIKNCLKQQNYVQLFLAMFNQNILMDRIKEPWNLKDERSKDKYRIAQENIQLKSYDLDNKFYELPKNVQNILKEIKPFVNYDYLYRLASEIDGELDKKIKQKKEIETNSSVTWDTNITRNYSKQKNLIHFILSNFLMIEGNYNFRAINKKLIMISIVRQILNDYFTLDKIEIFAVIKYIKYKDLIVILNEFKNKKFKLKVKDSNWLTIKVLPNIVTLFINDKTLYSHFSNELKNILYVLSLQELKNKQINEVLKQLKRLIINSSRKMNLDIYEQINELINSQKNISEKDLLDILELMINKIICSKGSIWDFQVIEKNYLWSPFKHLRKQKISYKNKVLIEKLLSELEQYDEREKIQFSQGFLYNIYIVSNEEIKEMIKEFIFEINLGKIENYGLKISFKLFLVIENFTKVDKELIQEVKQYPKKEEDNIYFLGQITAQVRYLVEELSLGVLQELLDELLKKLDNVKEKLKYERMGNII